MKALNVQIIGCTTHRMIANPLATPNGRNYSCKKTLPKLLSDSSSFNDESRSSDRTPTPKANFNPGNLKSTRNAIRGEKNLPQVTFRTKKQLDYQQNRVKKLHVTKTFNRGSLHEHLKIGNLGKEFDEEVKNVKKSVSTVSSDMRRSVLNTKISLLPRKPKGEPTTVKGNELLLTYRRQQ